MPERNRALSPPSDSLPFVNSKLSSWRRCPCDAEIYRFLAGWVWTERERTRSESALRSTLGFDLSIALSFGEAFSVYRNGSRTRVVPALFVEQSAVLQHRDQHA